MSPELQRIRTVWWEAWEPEESTGEVDLQEVERKCVVAAKRYRVRCLLYDPSQAKLMAQRMTRQGVATRELTFTPGNLDKMASSFLQVIESASLECYDKRGRLRGDFGKFNIVEKSYGHRLEAVSDEFGHADVGTALVICLPAAVDLLRGHGGLRADDVLVDENDEELAEAEVTDLPDELRELYEMEDETPRRRVSDPFDTGSW